MVKYLHKKCVQHKWLETSEDEMDLDSTPQTSRLGVMLKRGAANYASEPSIISPELLRAVERLGVTVAFTMSSDLTEALFQQITPLQIEVSLDPYGSVLPVTNSVNDLFTARSPVSPDAFMCACRRERFVLIWGDSAQSIMALGSDVETRLVGQVSECTSSCSVLSTEDT
jgi:hypothetical protein